MELVRAVVRRVAEVGRARAARREREREDVARAAHRGADAARRRAPVHRHRVELADDARTHAQEEDLGAIGEELETRHAEARARRGIGRGQEQRRLASVERHRVEAGARDVEDARGDAELQLLHDEAAARDQECRGATRDRRTVEGALRLRDRLGSEDDRRAIGREREWPEPPGGRIELHAQASIELDRDEVGFVREDHAVVRARRGNRGD